MITGDNDCITILAFNYGTAGSVVNGPGICLFNFVNVLKKRFPNLTINIFTKLKPHRTGVFCDTYNIENTKLLKDCIQRSSIIHHWSGIGDLYAGAINFSKSFNKTVFVGPNVIDTVHYEAEKKFLSKIKFDKLLTVNERLRFKISREHNISINLVSKLMIGPDLDLWSSSGSNNGKILWKGNSKQFVKDIEFAIKVSKKLNKYDFDFIGYPDSYDYFEHVKRAKNYKLYFSTSLSETMGMCLAEQWACGVPSVTHPNIYLHGKNYETGIITNRTVDDYCDAISEIMEDDELHFRLSNGCKKFIKENFNSDLIIKNYLNLLT